MFENIIKDINDAKTVGIFTHINPDGDALGSSYSLKLVLESIGKNAQVFISDEIESALEKLLIKGNKTDIKPSDCDLLVSLDCADIERLGSFKDCFSEDIKTCAIDHHITHKKFAKNVVVSDISSTCELIFQLYKEMNIDMSKEIATDIYIGLVTDTGNFKYASVTGDTHRAAAELIEFGVDVQNVSKIIFDTFSREYLMLHSYAAEKLKFFSENRISFLYLTDEEFNNFGINETEASAIVRLPSSIAGVEVGIYARERNENEIKFSLRSVNNVDVAKISESFGGGGHIRASGFSVEKKYFDDTIEKLVKIIEEQLR